MERRKARTRPPGSRKTPPALRPEDGWEHVIESLQEGLVAIDAEGRIRSMNQSAEQLTGSSTSSTRGLPHGRVFRGSPWVSELIDQVRRGDRGGIRADGEISGLWGKPVRVRASATPTFDADGRPTGVVLVLQDLSLQTGLEADQQRAESLSHLATAVAGLAHEIKNPLSGIRGAVQLLGREVGGDPAAAEYVGVVLHELDRLTALVERLLQLGARGTLPVTAVNVHEVIEHVLTLVGPEAERLGIRLVRLFDPSLPLVSGHRDSLVQVLLNLVQNATQAIAAATETAAREIRLSTRIETDYHSAPAEGDRRGRTRFLRVEVEDTGAGVPAELQPRLFSPFFTTKHRGTGLGLAISHRIVSDHGGTIRLESVPGRTVLRVILPVWTGAAG